MKDGLRAAVFIDRDGTLIQDREYLADPAGVVLVPGAVEALAELRRAGFVLVVVTNQSGIARGLYSEEDYRAVAARLDEVLAQAGVPLDGTYYCPHHPAHSGPCECRKPDTGMYLQASSDLGLDPEASWYVGDKVTDVMPALSMKGKGVLVRTGYGRESEETAPPWVQVVDDLSHAARLIGATVSARRIAVDPPQGPG